MSKLNKILLLIVVVLLVVLGIVIYWQKDGFKKPYWAVYLNTGDLYFGKLDRFPKFSLSDVWFLQRNPEDLQNPLSLTKFEQAFWGPKDKIYFNHKNIIWKTKLREDSEVVQFIENPENVQVPIRFQNQQLNQQPIDQLQQ